MKKTYVKILSCVSAASFLLTLSSCGDSKKKLESTKEDKTVVMTVGEYEVPLELYKYVALNTKSDYEKGGGSDIWLGESGAAKLSELEDSINETIVHLYTTLYVCDEYGISPDDSYITDTLDIQMDAIYEGYENDYDVYAEEIAEYHMNDSVYRFITRNDILSEELIHKMMDDKVIPSTDEELEGIISGPDFIHVKQILISNDNGNSEEENLALAEDILKKLNNGADFDEMIQQYGGDLYLFNTDNGYYISRGSYHEAFEEAAFSLEIGEISGIVKTDAGFSIIKRYPKDAEFIAENFNVLADDYIRGRYNLILAEKEKELSVTYTDAMEKYPVLSLK